MVQNTKTINNPAILHNYELLLPKLLFQLLIPKFQMVLFAFVQRKIETTFKLLLK